MFFLSLFVAVAAASPSRLVPRADCRTIQVQSGDSCSSLASRCGISGSDYMKYNPQPNHCSTLQVGQYVCCSSGTLPDRRPKQNADGSCYSYLVKSGDYCSAIASANSITVDNITSFNTKTWGWTGCDGLQAQMNICLSTGSPPMPASISNAVCGPQKPGTAKPSDMSTLANLNQCPLNSCCDKWGQCGTTDEFCTITQSATGNPGTSAPGTNGCISNCGTAITNNASPPSTFRRVGYFEGWNVKERSCLTMDVTQIDKTKYDTVHFAFGGITTDFQVNMTGVQDQFTKFVGMTGIKKVLSFGGWAFSTSADTSPIFRSAVTDGNRQTFINNLVAFAKQNNLDGYDFDWEYPGATDIAGAAPGSPDDGAKYLAFLTNLRSALGTSKTISIAAPASYWYLRNFPISSMAAQLDYIVFMTYDLHGQWDYGTRWGADGCPEGSCLRSHINITETNTAMSMITKAGVPANKILMGIASYARSFQKKDGCNGPTCHFTGPASGAQPGKCTKTAGYISNAELQDFQSTDTSVAMNYDASSDSVIMTWGTDQWASYMDNKVRQGRINWYQTLNFGGWAEWAIDLNINSTSIGDVYIGNSTAGGFYSVSNKGLSGQAYPDYNVIVNTYMRMPNPRQPCVFYVVPNGTLTRDGIINMAHSMYGVTLYDVYNPDDALQPPFNRYVGPLHDYLRRGQERGWFRVTSEAYARRCIGPAYLIWDGVYPMANPSQNWVSIWASEEFPAIYNGDSQIDRVYVVNPTTGTIASQPIWRRGDPAPPGWLNPQPPPQKRELQERTLFDADELGVSEVIYTDGTDLTTNLIEKREPNGLGIEQDPEGTVFTKGQDVGWVPGRCSFHFRQYIVGNGEGSSFDVDLFDHEQTNTIGGLRRTRLPNSGFAMASRLPYTLVIKPGEHPEDPVNFAYAGFSFSSNEGVCKTGKYDGNVPERKREGDCSFACSF